MIKTFSETIKSFFVRPRVSAFPPAHGKVYDVFTFFNELDLLEIRLNVLHPYVDYFVIIESTETFSGKPKPLYYQENAARFAQWHDKIIHFVTDDVPRGAADLRQRLSNSELSPLEQSIIHYTLDTDTFAKEDTHWLKEFYQKESIRKALEGLHNDDICFIGDLDEIWNPDAHFDFEKDGIFKLRQKAYVYYLNNRSSEAWAGTTMTHYKNIKNACLNHLRNRNKTRYAYIKNAGWHFTNMGGAEQIKKKLESYGHQEFNNDEIKSKIEQRIKNNQDFIGRTFKIWKDETDLPKYIINNKGKYKTLLI